MGALDLLDGWGSPGATAGVVGGSPQSVLAARGDTHDPRPWASVTKLVTALAVMVAVEEGSVDLDAPAGPPGSTVRHLLSHASGLPFDGQQVLAPPGRRRIYSNTGFDVLASVVADHAAMPFETYVTEAVLQPLRMEATRLDGSGSAAHGLVGPLDDLLALAAELLAPTVISAETLRSATSVVFPGLAGVLPGFGRQDPMDWGLGFELRDDKSPHWTGAANSVHTFGHFGGRGSFLWVDPEAGLACAALSGREFGAWAIDAWPALAGAVIDEFSAIPQRAPASEQVAERRYSGDRRTGE